MQRLGVLAWILVQNQHLGINIWLGAWYQKSLVPVGVVGDQVAIL